MMYEMLELPSLEALATLFISPPHISCAALKQSLPRLGKAPVIHTHPFPDPLL